MLQKTLFSKSMDSTQNFIDGHYLCLYSIQLYTYMTKIIWKVDIHIFKDLEHLTVMKLVFILSASSAWQISWLA